MTCEEMKTFERKMAVASLNTFTSFRMAKHLSDILYNAVSKCITVVFSWDHTHQVCLALVLQCSLASQLPLRPCSVYSPSKKPVL